ncbi:CODEINE O-DEMETHYLASE-LIKE [Salix purpurea]|uniref:CODEINE O-DEMETHYLASE-LIKE n=1 Tax=Salix purpurea TaxID=77065 RepID=A0A9Q0UL85_SALPP|nr:CODEINE O-DEMETHYLASE-LIKE [Salix purpurea]
MTFFSEPWRVSLNLEESCFLDQYGEQPLVTARFNFYPPCPKPDRILGVKPHADASAATFLLQDKEVEGLQFLKDNEWFRVPNLPTCSSSQCRRSSGDNEQWNIQEPSTQGGDKHKKGEEHSGCVLHS